MRNEKGVRIMKLVQIKEAAKQIGLSAYAIRVGIAMGKYPFVRVGTGRGHIFVDVETLEKIIEQEALENQNEAKMLVEQEFNKSVMLCGK